MEMKKEKLILLVVGLFLIMVFGVSGVLAVSGVNLKITGTIGDYTSDVRLRTDSNAGAGNTFDGYDMIAPDSPSDYSKFYSSSITGVTAASIDSWEEAERDITLIYDVPTSETSGGDVVFSWNDIASSVDYTASFSITGDVSNLDMVSDADNTYVYSAGDASDIYITIKIENVPVDGGGGGGAVSPVAGVGAGVGGVLIAGEDVFIGNKYMDVFIGLGLTKTKVINLYNPSDNPIAVTITLRTLALETDRAQELALSIDDSDLDFILLSGERKAVRVYVSIPEDTILGNYIGKIFVQGDIRQTINVNIQVTKQELLFDVELSIPWDYKVIEMGDDLFAHVTLEPMGDDPRLDVTTNYIIRDSFGNIVYESTKTFLITEIFNEDLSFPTGSVIAEEGEYVLELELIYPNGVAISRASFEIKRPGLLVLGGYKMIALVLGFGVFILILLIIFTVVRHKKIKRRR